MGAPLPRQQRAVGQLSAYSPRCCARDGNEPGTETGGRAPRVVVIPSKMPRLTKAITRLQFRGRPERGATRLSDLVEFSWAYPAPGKPEEGRLCPVRLLPPSQDAAAPEPPMSPRLS